MSTNNILSPANGKPIIVPSQDMVLGLYYLSMDRQGEPGEGMLLSDMAEVHQALEARAVTLHSKIIARVPQTDEAGKQYQKRFETTPGRMLIGECLPKSHTVPFDVVNRLLTKKEIGDVIDQVYRHTGQKDTVLFADAIMALGFRNAFKAGISFGKDDMIIPDSKDRAGRRDQGAGGRLRAAVSGRPDHPAGKVQQGDRRLEPLAATRWPRPMMDEIDAAPLDENGRRSADQLDLHDVAFRRAWFADADEAAGGYARADGQAFGRDHRNPDHLELQGRSDRP